MAVAKSDFGIWLGDHRRRTGLTLRELAEKSKLSLPYVAAIEKGVSQPPPLRTCKALAGAMGISWKEVWQHSFAERLRKWLRQQGYSHIPLEILEEITKKLEESKSPS